MAEELKKEAAPAEAPASAPAAEGAEGEAVCIFDITGRRVHNDALPTGVYLVKVGNSPARKIVVIK